MTLPNGRRLQPNMPTAAIIGLLALLTVFLSVVSASWTEQFSVSGSIRTGNWSTPSATPGRTGTTFTMDQTALGFFENGKYGVAGTILVQNSGPSETRDLQIASTVKIKTGQGQYVDYVRSVIDVSAKPILAPGQSYLYKYRITFDPVPGALYLHNAEATITNYTNWMAGDRNCRGSALCPFGSGKDATFVLPVPPPPSTNTVTATPTPTVNSAGPTPAAATSTAVLPSPPPNLPLLTATSTATMAATPTLQATASPAPTFSPTATTSPTPTASPTPTFSPTATTSPTATASPQATMLPQVTNKSTPVTLPTGTASPTVTPPTATAVPPTLTSTATPTLTATPTSSAASTTPTK